MDSRTSRANKAKGAGFESAITVYLRSLGYRASRLARRGRKDEGDVAIDIGDIHFVIEAKATKALSLAEWIAESQVEAANYAEARGLAAERVIPVVVAKRRMKGVAQSYALVELETLTRIISL